MTSINPLSHEVQADILDRAFVPEHSVAFMQAMSGGTAFLEGNYLFIAGDDWLMSIGYPLLPAGGRKLDCDSATPWQQDVYKTGELTAAVSAALERTRARSCWAVAPDLPEDLAEYEESRDVFFTLDVNAEIPQKLQGPVRSAQERLRVTEHRDFTPEHRRLWAEFLGRVAMRPNVRELYARTEAVLAASRASCNDSGILAGEKRPLLDLRLLSAWDREGRLAASLLLDFSPSNFCSYIIGAHSRAHYSAHATDLLFASMLAICRKEGKQYVHLGLGVNEGITRFKRKWGGCEALPYVMAGWSRADKDGKPLDESPSEIVAAMRNFLQTPPDMSKQQIFDSFPKQRSFAMLRAVEKGGALSYLCGTAHFFCYSFELSFREIFEPLHTVIFEGPLDSGFLADVERVGRSPEPGARRVLDGLTEEEIRDLERMVYGPEGFLPKLFGMQQERTIDVRGLLAGTRPWFAFFSLWVAFLERQGWSQSVDLEAWATAGDMGKVVIGMESLEEQIASLEAVPFTRIIDFLRRCGEWPAYMKRNIKSYLGGDLEQMVGSSIEFPSRTEMVIEFRDTRFFERMLPFMEAGNCAVFVGTAHLLGLIPMLERAGFTVRPACFGRGRKLRAAVRKLFG